MPAYLVTLDRNKSGQTLTHGADAVVPRVLAAVKQAE